MNNSNSSNRGCLVAALIIAAILVIGGVGMATFPFRFKARDSAMLRSEQIQLAHETATRMNSAEGSNGPLVVIDRATLGNYSATEFGETLDAKQYVAIACAPNLTSLAEQKFIEAANGMPVDWPVRIEDIKADSNKEGQITGEFSMPYEIRKGLSGHGSSITISATFPVEMSDDLISLRTGETVHIRGKLQTRNRSTNSVRILDPEIVTGDP
jgi:hypothetical protein